MDLPLDILLADLRLLVNSSIVYEYSIEYMISSYIYENMKSLY